MKDRELHDQVGNVIVIKPMVVKKPLPPAVTRRNLGWMKRAHFAWINSGNCQQARGWLDQEMLATLVRGKILILKPACG